PLYRFPKALHATPQSLVIIKSEHSADQVSGILNGSSYGVVGYASHGIFYYENDWESLRHINIPVYLVLPNTQQSQSLTFRFSNVLKYIVPDLHVVDSTTYEKSNGLSCVYEQLRNNTL